MYGKPAINKFNNNDKKLFKINNNKIINKSSFLKIHQLYFTNKKY